MEKPGPLDAIDVQLPGRILALEIMFGVMLRGIGAANAEHIFKQADAVLSDIESKLFAEGGQPSAEAAQEALKTFAAARASLDWLRANSMPR